MHAFEDTHYLTHPTILKTLATWILKWEWAYKIHGNPSTQ